ncbi:hypothetical protein HPC49_34710 [Pyxidicoccus fallax]|uniref:Lipoprotein n=1 Tax=Pyxidicoccus fallax TaxID=394095 RepID=A0A848LS35_9BACT|nr:hypothetical protein [Pyxidicoccus fallax]NMO20501.1 hypothetical protein [Pyxidicoccus fallax]NPC83362.1 hypothetical protein [Pyxidicoccus fallax]
MKRLIVPSVLLTTALFVGCGPAPEQPPQPDPAPATSQSLTTIELVETALDPRLAATAAQAGAAVYALEINEPVSGPVSPRDAALIAIDTVSEPRLPWVYGATLTRAQVRESLGTTLVDDIERYVNTGESYSAVVYGWSYPKAPDFCDTGHFYALIFNQARFVMTVEVNGERDC